MIVFDGKADYISISDIPYFGDSKIEKEELRRNIIGLLDIP